MAEDEKGTIKSDDYPAAISRGGSMGSSGNAEGECLGGTRDRTVSERGGCNGGPRRRRSAWEPESATLRSWRRYVQISMLPEVTEGGVRPEATEYP